MTWRIFLITLLWRQNNYHAHGVLVHTLRVCLEVIKAKKWRMLPAALLHDVGKPGVAYQKLEDQKTGEYSFTDHEEASYLIIKSWPFLSNYTKDLVRYHYLIRRMTKAKQKGLAEYAFLKQTWDKISPQMQKEIAQFMRLDDLGKGK